MAVAAGRLGWWPGGGSGTPGGFDAQAESVREHQPVRLLRVTTDVQMPGVMEAVMPRTQADQVVRVGRTAVFPVDEVVDLHVTAGGATGDATAAVAMLDQHPDPLGDDAVRSSSGHRDPVGLPHRNQHTVTPQPSAHGVGEQRAVGEGGPARLEVDVDPVPVPTRRAVDRAEAALADLDQGVPPRHVVTTGLPDRVARLA